MRIACAIASASASAAASSALAIARISASSSGSSQHRCEIGALLLLGAIGPDRRDDRLEFVELARQRRIFGAGDALGEARADFLVAAQDEIEIVVGGHGFRIRTAGGCGEARR